MMDAIDYQLIEAMQNGLPVCSRPYSSIAKSLNMTEQDVIDRISQLKQQGLVKRLGVIVNHRQLGYSANAMVVMNVPDHLVDEIGTQVSQFQFVNLCYLRPRHGDTWPYNLYCMIHGKDRTRVLEQLDHLKQACNLTEYSLEILFSKRCFKQRGALYTPGKTMETANG